MSLPFWVARPGKRDAGITWLQCPRCSWVVGVRTRDLENRREVTEYTSAPCFHCFRAARLPGEENP